MNVVCIEYKDFFGVPVKEIPCVTGSGAPTAKTICAVGIFYMNTDNGDLYKCVASNDGGHIWEPMITMPAYTQKDNNKFLGVVNGNVVWEPIVTVPTYTQEDNNKFLRVIDGKMAWSTIPNAEEVSF